MHRPVGEDEAPQAKQRSSAVSARIKAPKPERGGAWGPHWGNSLGREYSPLHRKSFDLGSQYSKFWCILGGIFYSSATCFTRKTV